MRDNDEIHKCVKCGNPDIWQSWNKTYLCRICFDDLYADAKLVQKEILQEILKEV